MLVNNLSFSFFAVSSSPLSQWQLHSAEGNWSAVCVVTHMTPSLGDMPAKLGVLLWHLVDLPLAIGGLSCWCWVWSFGNLHNSPQVQFQVVDSAWHIKGRYILTCTEQSCRLTNRGAGTGIRHAAFGTRLNVSTLSRHVPGTSRFWVLIPEIAYAVYEWTTRVPQFHCLMIIGATVRNWNPDGKFMVQLFSNFFV